MVKDTEKFISLCEICQTTKWTSQWMPGLLHQLPILDAPWTSIVMDFIGPFPKSLNSNYLWVIVCHLTSQVHLVPIKTTTNALEFAYEFLRNVVHFQSQLSQTETQSSHPNSGLNYITYLGSD